MSIRVALSDCGEQDALRQPGTAVAAGLPLVVRLLVPLWVANATTLPISVGITNVSPQQQQPRSPPDPDNPQRGMLDANAIKMHTLDTRHESRCCCRLTDWHSLLCYGHLCMYMNLSGIR